MNGPAESIGDLPGHRKKRGAFFTPAEICTFLVEWAIREPGARVLEPSCGEAAFLLSAGQRLAALGCEEPGAQLVGVELHEESARRARRLVEDAGLIAVTVLGGDFFEMEGAGSFDAVVGNPPYVRYQAFNGDGRARSQRVALKNGVRLSALASSWAAFVVHACDWLKADGRLALVLPAELLTVNYAAPVREFLLRRFGRVRLVMFRERVFPGVTEEVVLLLADGVGPAHRPEVSEARNLQDLVLADTDSWLPVTADARGRWVGGLVSNSALAVIKGLSRARAFVPLAIWGDPTLGMVTGSNQFFALSVSLANEYAVDPADLLPISPPGSKHLRGIAFSQDLWSRLKDEDQRVYLLYPREEMSRGAKAYVQWGEQQAVPEAYKCRVRTPWWRVPLVRKPDLFLTYMNHDAPRLVSNGAEVNHLNSVHGMCLRGGLGELGRALLPLAILNSATFLGAELSGRTYGGGILKVEPREAEAMPVPSPDLLDATSGELSSLVAGLSPDAPLRGESLERIVAKVDEIVLGSAAGLSGRDIRALREARQALFERRSARH